MLFNLQQRSASTITPYSPRPQVSPSQSHYVSQPQSPSISLNLPKSLCPSVPRPYLSQINQTPDSTFASLLLLNHILYGENACPEEFFFIFFYPFRFFIGVSVWVLKT